MTIRLRRIDESTIGDHAHLRSQDRCFYIYEYTSQRRFDFSETNQLISNLKIKPTEAHRLRHKTPAIRSCAAALRRVLPEPWLARATLVPAPPSKIIGDPDYDNRMERVARAVRADQDVRQIVRQTVSTLAAHEIGAAGRRPSVQDLIDIYDVDETLTQGEPSEIGILDDVLTNGSHFKAMQVILGQRFPDAKIRGIFIARRAFPPIEF